MRIMKAKDAAKYIEEAYGWRMSLHTFYREVRRHGIRRYRLPGGMGFSQDDIEQYIEGRHV